MFPRNARASRMRWLRAALLLLAGVLPMVPGPGAAWTDTVPLTATPAWMTEGNQVSAFYGGSVASAGDVNGDGYDDILVGAYAFEAPISNEGRAFLYLGSPSGPQVTPAWTAEADQPDSYFGWSVASAGDVNGDGYADVLIGAKQYGEGDTWDGRAFVFLGSPSGLSTIPQWTADSEQASAEFGIVGRFRGGRQRRRLRRRHRGRLPLQQRPAVRGRSLSLPRIALGTRDLSRLDAEGDQVAANFGYAVAGAGDVNGDGYADVIVAAYTFDHGETDEGKVFVYYGSASGLPANPSWTAEGNQASAYFGYSVASAGDVNGDGYADIIVGAVSYDNGQIERGPSLRVSTARPRDSRRTRTGRRRAIRRSLSSASRSPRRGT